MKKSKPTPPAAVSPEATTVSVSDVTLELTPPRLLKFLRAVGTRPAIYAALSAVGYSGAEHRQGWKLLHAASGFQEPGAAPGTPVDPKVSKAIAELDAQDERIHTRIEASLKHRHPTVLAALHKAIAPGKGPAAVLYFRALLDRLDALSKARGEGAGEAQAALKLLHDRGITEAWRKETRDRLALAEALPASSPDGVTEGDADALRAALLQARAWYEEWSTIAKTEVNRKDYLILLGLAQRKTRANGKEPKTPQGKPTEPEAE